ncbi:MAG: toxin-antitoxin system YwqK family antitoxin [Endomicrobia bacterium]|nr:toxin-antitoxin system YwqK family antitoxin [Endomicrobiia bacterium]
MRNRSLKACSVMFCFAALFLFSCASSKSAKREVLGPDDQVASAKPVIIAKKIEIGRYPDGTAKGYKYVSNYSADTVYATETIDAKGNSILDGKIPDGMIVQYYDKGNVAAEYNYNAGKLEGIVKEYYPDGSVAAVKNYKAGELSGPVKEYYPNGNVREESSYSDGILSGSVRKYSDTGTLLSRDEYQDGDLNGVCKEFYINGKTKTETEYMNNKKEGFRKEYDAGGILLAEYNYSSDKLEGQQKKYYEDGNIQMIANYANNKQEGETKIFSNNNSDTPIFIDIYKNGVKIKRRAYSTQGKILFTTNY